MQPHKSGANMKGFTGRKKKTKQVFLVKKKKRKMKSLIFPSWKNVLSAFSKNKL